MLFGRKNLFSATDAFPLTDAVLEFDDSSSVAVRPGRRALVGFGRRGELGACAKWWAVAGLIALYAVDLAGFYALGVVGVQVLQALAGLGAAGLAVFGAVFRLSLQRKRRLRHVKPKEGVRNQVGIDQAIAMRDIADGGLVGPRWPRVPVAAGPDGRANRRPVQMPGGRAKDDLAGRSLKFV